jgi:predicted outer membrane repeat protein
MKTTEKKINGKRFLAWVLIASAIIWPVFGCNDDDFANVDADAGADAGTDAGTDGGCTDGTWNDAFDEADCPDMSGWSASVVHVRPDAAPGGDGRTWGTAFSDLQTALDTARCGVATAELCDAWQVWAAAGSYYVFEECPGDTIWLRSDVELYGGFAGTETSLEARDPDVNETILDGADGPDGEDRVGAVVYAASVYGAVLDGFTITRASDEYSDGDWTYGDGLYAVDSTVSIRSCLFTGNQGDWGAGMLVLQSAVEVTDSRFVDNAAFTGSAMAAQLSSISIEGCLFSGNHATEDSALSVPGAVMLLESSAQISSSNFSGNSGAAGGGLFVWGSTADVRGCDFDGNTATSCWGGAIAAMESQGDDLIIHPAFLTVSESSFSNNTASQAGGAISGSLSNPTFFVSGCTFTANTAPEGGAIQLGADSIEISNSVFRENAATSGTGGAMLAYIGSGSMTIVATTFAGNTASGGGDALWANHQFSVANSILWNNGDAPIAPDTALVTYSDVQGGYAGDGNLDADPLFVDAAGGDLHLQAGSPCIDTGLTSALPADTFDLDGDSDTSEPLPYDLEGNARVVDGGVDMGAYEVQP